MKKKRRVLPLVLAVVLALSLTPASAATLYFTAVNNTVAPLTSETMPFWSGGTLYVPYTIFDASLNNVGVGLGLYTSYNRDSRTVTLYNLRQMLTFDLNSGTCLDEVTGTTYISRAIMRGGRPYLALNTVCSHFDLEYSYNQLPDIPQGFLVRIKSSDTVMSDADFIDAAKNVINNRLREYTQGLNPAESTDPGTNPSTQNPGGTTVPDKDGPAAYLAFRCESGAGLSDILDALDSRDRRAVFFLAPQVLEEERDLVRRMLGTGYSVGILADGDNPAEELEWGQLILEELTHTRTTLAYAPAGQRERLEQEGWICWRESVLAEPSDSISASAFSANTINRLGNRNATVYLTLAGGENTARVLSALLRSLGENHFVVDIPVETKL